MFRKVIGCCLAVILLGCNKSQGVVGTEPTPSQLVPPTPILEVLVESLGGVVYDSKLKGEDNPDKPHTWTAPDGSYSISNVGVHEYMSIEESTGNGVMVNIMVNPGYALLRYAYRFEGDAPSSNVNADRRWKSVNVLGESTPLTSVFFHNTKTGGIKVPKGVRKVILCVDVVPSIRLSDALAPITISSKLHVSSYTPDPSEGGENAILTPSGEERSPIYEAYAIAHRVRITLPDAPKGLWMPVLTGSIGGERFTLSPNGRRNFEVVKKVAPGSIATEQTRWQGRGYSIETLLRRHADLFGKSAPKVTIDPPYKVGEIVYQIENH